MKCNKNKVCDVHEGRKNLRKLRRLIQKIKPNHIGWKIGLKWNIVKGGFLETLFNFRHLREEFIQTKREVDKYRLELPKYKEEIDPERVKKKKPGISKRIPAKKK